MEGDGLAAPRDHGALQVIVQDSAGHAAERFERLDMAMEEAAHLRVVEQAQKGLARVAEGHEKPHQLALGPTDPDTPEIGPVDLGLLGGEEAAPPQWLGPLDRPETEGAQGVAEMVFAAAVAPVPRPARKGCWPAGPRSPRASPR